MMILLCCKLRFMKSSFGISGFIIPLFSQLPYRFIFIFELQFENFVLVYTFFHLCDIFEINY